jgi:hypothetical protein
LSNLGGFLFQVISTPSLNEKAPCQSGDEPKPERVFDLNRGNEKEGGHTGKDEHIDVREVIGND